MANLAKLVVRLEAESSQLRKELERTNRQLQGFGAKAKKTFGVATSAVKGFVGAFAGYEIISATIKEISSLEKTLSGVEAVTQATTKQMQDLTKNARMLGATTVFSATEAAQGMEFLGRAGFSTNEIISAMPGLLDLAAAGALELGNAADIASNVLSGFNLEASKTIEVADVLAATAAGSNTSVEQLGLAMSYVAPVAAAMGKSVQETSAAIGILGNAGIQASTAGTALRGMLSRLASITPEAAEAIENLGIKVEELNPETKSFTEIVDRLAEAGLTAGDALTIFGDRAGPAVLALVSQNDALREFVAQMAGAGGTARRMAEVMNDNLAGDVKALGSAVAELAQALGDAGLTAALRGAVQGLTGFARSISEIIQGKSLEKLGKQLGVLQDPEKNRNFRSGLDRRIRGVQEEIQERLEDIEGPEGLRATLSRVDDEFASAKQLVERIQSSINKIPEEDRNNWSLLKGGFFGDDAPWTILNSRLEKATKEMELIGKERQRIFDELFELEDQANTGNNDAVKKAVAAAEALTAKRIEGVQAVAAAEEAVVRKLQTQRASFDEIVRKAREVISGETKNPLTEGTLIEALRALEKAKTFESAGDREGAFNKAKETVGLVTKLVEAGKLSKQYASTLVDQAQEIGEAASNQMIELKLDDAVLKSEAERARVLIQSNFSAEPFTATIQWMNPGGPDTQLARGATTSDGSPIIFNMPDGRSVEVTATGENVTELRRSLGTYVDKNGPK